MVSRNKFEMCRLCLCKNECFVNIFDLNDWQGYVAAEVISDLLQFQVSESDGYPHLVCLTCLTKLTDFKLFKECCQKSKNMYDNLFVTRESPEEHQPEMATIKSEEVIIDSSSYEAFEDPLKECEVSCGPILFKNEVLPFSTDSHPKEELIDSEGSENLGTVESTAALMGVSLQVQLPHVETVTHAKYQHFMEDKKPHFTSKGEIEAYSCTWSISTNDELIFEKTKNISLSEEVEASSSGTMERLELQRILPGESMDMAFHFQQEKKRVRMEQDIGGDGEASRETVRGKGARERREGLECFHCGIVLMSKLALIQHMKFHGFVNSYDCSESSEVFHYNGEFKTPLLTNTGWKPHKCAECTKSFSDRSKLKKHMRIHTGSKLYKCAECSKSFRENGDLKRHIRIHTGSKPYSCAECSKHFSRNDALTTHMRIHTGSKPYKCEECSKTFRHSTSLKIHMKLHKG